ncbi:MAG: oligosaccharide flippase family protein [Flavobacteriaceae bacterium]|nr:oligosaccharide flippase family protein [Bacteroidia bacterium]NNF76258.1 oligosaccharide flippase family protein [Flavobacteriaceae bacterium]NNK74402.1 oligosaccharide flippase family protein [Flavobacteriaceae bacterium]
MNKALNIIASIQGRANFKLTQEQIFMLSVILVNGGNYLYNLILGRMLGPERFADAAILITFLLVLSFVAMTFQLAVAKYTVLFEGRSLLYFKQRMMKFAILTGFVIGLTVVIFSSSLQKLLNTSSQLMFVIFGCAIPFYFAMSVNRGFFQGSKALKALSWTYKGEMLSRLFLTLALILLFPFHSIHMVSLGIAVSFIVALFPFNYKDFKKRIVFKLTRGQKRSISRFVMITAFYELTQIIINNSDIILVKHYFDSYEAGLYASLAMIGRVLYFLTWMFVMLLLPTVVERKKEGKPTHEILTKYASYIFGIAALTVIGCLLFPNLIINLLFGEQYLSMSHMLWQYALATALFALSNLFAYYYLSLERYFPVVLSAVFGILQVLLVVIWHSSLIEIVQMQIWAMAMLLFTQLGFFIWDYYTSRKSDYPNQQAIHRQ